MLRLCEVAAVRYSSLRAFGAPFLSGVRGSFESEDALLPSLTAEQG